MSSNDLLRVSVTWQLLFALGGGFFPRKEARSSSSPIIFRGFCSETSLVFSSCSHGWCGSSIVVKIQTWKKCLSHGNGGEMDRPYFRKVLAGPRWFAHLLHFFPMGLVENDPNWKGNSNFVVGNSMKFHCSKNFPMAVFKVPVIQLMDQTPRTTLRHSGKTV